MKKLGIFKLISITAFAAAGVFGLLNAKSLDEDVISASAVSAGEKVYLDPGIWHTGSGTTNEWFAAYFFNADKTGGTFWTGLSEDGIYYSCTVPSGFDSVIFTRMNKDLHNLDWNSKSTVQWIS